MRKIRAMLNATFLPILVGAALSLTGCQMMHDLFPFFGGDDEAGNIDVPPTDDVPEQTWTAPGEGVASPDDWEVVKSVKFPVIYFSYDQCAIGTRERRILDKVAEYLVGKDGYGLIISGHCDERGSKEYNMALGEKRALAVKDYLVSKGIPEARLRTVSHGEEKPAVEGHDEAAYAKNRRAELELAKIK